MPAKQKYDFYVKRLNWIADHLRANYPKRYGHLANIEMFYELCEYNKALVYWYLGGGKPYKATDYSYDNDRIRPLDIELKSFTNLRVSAVAFLEAQRGALIDEQEYPNHSL